MKRVKFIFLHLLFLLTLFPHTLYAGWHISTVDPDGDVGQYTSIDVDQNGYPRISYYCGTFVGEHCRVAMDSFNHPHIVYYDWTNGDLKYTSWTGSTWNIQTIDSTGDVGEYCSLTIDTSNRPHIAYYDWTNDNLKYATWTGSSWNIQTVDNSIDDVGMYTSIQVDSNTRAHISYLDWTNGNLKHAYWTGTSWQITAVDYATSFVGEYNSLDLDNSGYPNIAYYDSTGGDLKFARWDGIRWSTNTVDGIGLIEVGLYTSLQIDTGNRPCISYFDYTTATLKYARWTGLAWARQPVYTGSDYVGEYSSLVLDNNNYAQITFYDWTNHSLKYAFQISPSSWTISTIDSTADVGTYSSLARDSLNNLHVAYFDSSNFDLKYAFFNGISWTVQTIDGGTNDLKYARWDGTAWSIQTVDSTGDVGEYTSIKINPQDGTTGLSYFDWTSSDLKFAKHQPTTGWQIETVESAGNTGMYTSLSINKYGNYGIAYYDSTNSDMKYVTNSGGMGWSFTVIDSSGDVGLYSCLNYDTNNIPHLSYYDWSTGNLKYGTNPGTGWTYQIIDSSNDVGLYTSLGLTSDNNPHMSYYDWTNGDLKYARWTGVQWSTQTVDSTGDVGWHTKLGVDYTDKIQLVYYDWTNQDLKYARPSGTGWDIETVDTAGNVGEYCSLAIDKYGRPHISYLDLTNFNLKYARYEPEYTVSGYVRDKTGTGINGVTVNLTGDKTVVYVTTSSGYYEFTGLYIGTYTVTVTFPEWTFIPNNRNYAPLYNNYTNQDFTGNPPTYYIKGYIYRQPGGTPLSNVTLTLSGKTGGTYLTDNTGYYEFNNLETGNYTLTPTRTGWNFIPSIYNYSPLTENATNQNYTASLTTYTISGYIIDGSSTGINAVLVSLTGDTTASYLTGSDGKYDFTNLSIGNYNISIDKTGWIFNPQSRGYVNLSQTYETQTFYGTYIGTSTVVYSIQGNVYTDLGFPLSGIEVTLTGQGTGNTLTNSAGNYDFFNLLAGSYTVTVKGQGYNFQPTYYIYTTLTNNATNQNFIATSIKYKVSGYILNTSSAGIPNVTLTLTGKSNGTYKTADTGYYEITDLVSGDYVVTPVLTGYFFSPERRTYVQLTNHQENQNFTGSAISTVTYFTVSGYVRLVNTSSGLSDVSVKLTGTVNNTYTTTSDGFYTFVNLPSYGMYTIKVTKSGWNFNPSSYTYLNLLANQINQNFNANFIVYYISGLVKEQNGQPIPNVQLNLTGETTAQLTTSTTGYYEFNNLYPGNYLLTPTKPGWIFNPQNNLYRPLSDNQTQQNFTGSPVKYYIKGYIRDVTGMGVPQVMVSLTTGTVTTTFLTSSNGYFQFIDLNYGNYIVTPSSTGWGFTPLTKTYQPLQNNQDEQNFVAVTGTVYLLKGTVRDSSGKGIPDVTIILTGNGTSVKVTDTQGNYEFSALVTGEYTVTITKPGWSFSPVNQTVWLISDTNVPDFTGLVGSLSNTELILKPVNNLFNPQKGEKTTLWISLPKEEQTKLQIYSSDGTLIKTIIDNNTIGPGFYAYEWDGKNNIQQTVSSGVYLTVLQTSRDKQIKKIIVIR